jgi:hypothetical protein
MLLVSQGIAAAAVVAAYDDVKEQLVPLALGLLRDPEADIRVAVLRQLPELGTSYLTAFVPCPSQNFLQLLTGPMLLAGAAVKAKGCGPQQQQVLESLLEALHPLLLADDDEVGFGAVRYEAAHIGLATFWLGLLPTSALHGCA